MILLKLDRRCQTPLYTQIINQIKEMVETDILKPGTRLPSSRLMAETLDVNRSTVYNAYQELWAQGYIESRPGSYSIIRKRHKIAFLKNISNFDQKNLPPGELILLTLLNSIWIHDFFQVKISGDA